MKRTTITFALITFLFNASVAQVTIKGVALSPKIVPAKTTLVLNGAGVRTNHFIKVYVAGFYLQSKTSIPKEIIEEDKQMCVRLSIISTLINSDNMTRTIREGFDKSTGGKSERFKKEIDDICVIFQSDVIKVGDMFEIYYVPGSGLHSNKNGKDMAVNIKGIDFKKALFGIWFGEDPVDYDLKKGMLGL